MLHLLRPDIKLNNIYELTGELLEAMNVTVLIADLDNTIAKYEHETPNDDVCKWAEDLAAHGVSLAIVSNNCRERVEKFCKPLGIVHFWKSGKPSRKTIRKAMQELGGTKETTALIGDKIVTDIIGAKRSGILAIKVPPLGKRRMFE
ncbi:MAG: YqeG family HAD IIIA-type phosphatase [Oscillospiraceae bacterium]|nr:YqeG family HAD IIIA-type phosphatase [Oscillospiraceae bacterium]